MNTSILPFAVATSISKIKHTFKFILFCCYLQFFIPVSKVTAQVTIKWDLTYGGNGTDLLQCQQQTSDGGYILGGTSNSQAGDDKSKNSKGQEDYWIIKIDAKGKKQWDKTFGGKGKDFFQVVQQTMDGGYILGGYSDSPVSGDKSVVASYEFDYWVIKVDAKGNKQWDKSFGGSRNDFLISLQATSDKGYILGGTSNSPASGKVGMNKSVSSKKEKDYWIVKLNAAGEKEWDRTIGGSSFDFLRVVKQTSDKGYILGGYSYSPSSNNKTGANKGFGDFWIVKVNNLGRIEWNKTIGGSNEDVLESLEITKDGHYILGGTSYSPASGNKTQASKGEADYWLVKINKSGTVVWDKTIGGSRKDNLRSVRQTSDGGYILGGYSASPVSGNKTETSNKDVDFWVVKVNHAGSVVWDKTIGGNKEDGLQSVQQIGNGQYILGGYSQSSATEDKTAERIGNYDYWLVNILVKSESGGNISGNYSLTVATNGKGSVATSSKKESYISGSVISLTARPAKGYRFTGWSGTVNSFQNPITLTMNSNKNITAIFDPIDRNVYEAEEATLKGAISNNEHTDYRGQGYADIRSNNYAIIHWTFEEKKATACEITFRYSNGSGNSYPLKIIVNGEIINEAKQFKATETWSTWSDVTVKAVLKAGINEVKLKSSEKGGPNIDYLRLAPITNATKSIETTSNNPVLVEGQEEVLAIPETGITAYPNPFTATTNLVFTFAQEEEYELAIYNLDGTLIKSFLPTIAKANEVISLTWEAQAVESGIYVARLKTRNKVQTLRLIKN